jgi:hypothetical protein
MKDSDKQLPGMEEMATGEQVSALVKLGYKAEKVYQWPRWQAATVLKGRQEEAARAYLQAPDKWDGEVPTESRPAAAFELEDAAKFLESGTDKHLTLSYAVFLLSDEQAGKLAEWMARKFRGVA